MDKKRTILLTAVLPLFLAGCINDEYRYPLRDVIKFSAKVDNVSLVANTRASYTDVSFTEFNVTALGDAASYFQNLKVTKQSDGSWQTATTKYWPAYPLRFLGYAPISLQSKANIGISEQKLTGYTVVSEAASQDDIVTAYVKAGQTSASGAAILGFHHALSQIEVVAKNGSPNDYTIEVLGVKICQIPSTADLTFQTDPDAAPVWSAASAPKDYIIKGSYPLTLTSTPQSIMFGSNNFLLVPQGLVPWTGGTTPNGAYISVLCRIKDKLGNLVYPTDASKFGFAAMPISETWQSQHKYTYTLAFYTNGGGAGRIDPSPSNPENPSDVNVDTTPGGPGKQGGDIVTPDSQVPITMTVSISDWVVGADDNIDLEF